MEDDNLGWSSQSGNGTQGGGKGRGWVIAIHLDNGIVLGGVNDNLITTQNTGDDACLRWERFF